MYTEPFRPQYPDESYALFLDWSEEDLYDLIDEDELLLTYEEERELVSLMHESFAASERVNEACADLLKETYEKWRDARHGK
jgi:hypothetical protein